METYRGKWLPRVTKSELIGKDLEIELTHTEAALLLQLATHSTHPFYSF